MLSLQRKLDSNNIISISLSSVNSPCKEKSEEITYQQSKKFGVQQNGVKNFPVQLKKSDNHNEQSPQSIKSQCSKNSNEDNIIFSVEVGVQELIPLTKKCN